MSTVAVPHFAFPLQMNGSTFLVREQDTTEEIQDCVLVLLLTPLGSRTPEVLYSQMPPNIPAILAECNTWEQRALVDLDTTINTLDEKIVTLTASVTGGTL